MLGLQRLTPHEYRILRELYAADMGEDEQKHGRCRKDALSMRRKLIHVAKRSPPLLDFEMLIVATEWQSGTADAAEE